MEQKYFIQHGSEKKGPFSLHELRQHNIQKETLIWYSGLNNWTEANKLYELKSLFDNPPPVNLNTVAQQNPAYFQQNAVASASLYRVGKIEYLRDNTVEVHYDHEIVQYRYANFIERFGARLLDSFIIVIPSLFLPIIASWLYFALMHSSSDQQSLGQKAVGIRLLSTDGAKVSFGQSTGRFFAHILDVLTFLVGYLMFFFNNKNQCLHDSVSSTIVVSEIRRVRK